MPRSAPLSEPYPVKASLRAEALGRRAVLGAAARLEASRAAAARARAAMAPVEGKVVGLFASFRDEIDTRPLAELLWSDGASIALPVIVGRDAPLLFRQWEAGDTLSRDGAFAIPTPGPQARELQPDILLVPLAAFDRRGWRIGYGAGFYDRTLAKLRARRPILAIGYAFACQEVAAIPAEPHDERVDLVVTESDVIMATP